MHNSSSTASAHQKKKIFLSNRGCQIVTSVDNGIKNADKNFLTISPALPTKEIKRELYHRSHSTLIENSHRSNDGALSSNVVILHSYPDGSLHLSRTQKEKDKNPDRINLDRKGLIAVPVIEGESKLRLLSLQHNLITNFIGFYNQKFPFLVFLDVYDNQLEKVESLSSLENLRVLLMGKNRLKKIEGLNSLMKIEVLDFHGNQIQQITGLSSLRELKVLNLAGNQISVVGVNDLRGLVSLQELNLRRNRLKKLFGFGEVLCLLKLFLSNNEIQNIEDMSSIAKAINLKEITIDNNPVSLGGDCVSFLVSYLPQLISLNSSQITDHVRKAAMAWKHNKEQSDAIFMGLTKDVMSSVRREEIISNARTNWELLRTQTKCLIGKFSNCNSTAAANGMNKPYNDLVFTSVIKPEVQQTNIHTNSKIPSSGLTRVKNACMIHTSSHEMEISDDASLNTSDNEYFRLPPILLPIINKVEVNTETKENLQCSESLSSIDPNVNSSSSSFSTACSNSISIFESSSSTESVSDNESEASHISKEKLNDDSPLNEKHFSPDSQTETSVDLSKTKNDNTSDISIVTSLSNVTIPNMLPNEGTKIKNKNARNVKSAVNLKTLQTKVHTRSQTAKPKKVLSPSVPLSKDKEQGGDYLIEICGRYLNIYGQGALRFIDKAWNISKASDVNTVNFNYVNFTAITTVLNKIKQKFPNADNFIFKETNIQCLGQLNALAEIQGFTSLYIDKEGNPIIEKKWESYAIYRLSHWGVRNINNKEITEEDIKTANEEYQSLSDLVLWLLPEVFLQPLLARLHLDVVQSGNIHCAKKWLISADPALKSVVCKEALQWKKGAIHQDDVAFRQKAKPHISYILDEMCNAVNKLQLLEEKWSSFLYEIIRNTLLDYSQIDSYMRKKIQEIK